MADSNAIDRFRDIKKKIRRRAQVSINLVHCLRPSDHAKINIGITNWAHRNFDAEMGKPLVSRALVITILTIVLMYAGQACAQKLTVDWSAVSALNAPFWVMKMPVFSTKKVWIAI
jgi:hypothetical protein